MYLSPFIKKISFTFYKKLVENLNFFSAKTAYYVKKAKKFNILIEKFAFYGLDMKLEPEPEFF
jgi:hypothetical protein